MQSLEEEKAQFRNTKTVDDAQETHSQSRDIVGEHIHHHVHETIQPVIQKETIQPSTIHTTIPIHEVHHNEPKLHSVSTLPAVGMDAFKRDGGPLDGRGELRDRFSGEPKPIEETLGGRSKLETTDPIQEKDSNGVESYHTSSATARHSKLSALKQSLLGPSHNKSTTRYADEVDAGAGRNTSPEHKSSLLQKLKPSKGHE
jgi:hypothetical protein